MISLQKKLLVFFKTTKLEPLDLTPMSGGRLTWFRHTTKALLLHCFGEDTSVRTVLADEVSVGGFHWMNKQALGRVVEPCTGIALASMYPTLIARLHKEGRLECNSIDLLVLFAEMVESRYVAKANLPSDAWFAWKQYLNMFYGCVGNQNSRYQVKGMNLVTEYGRIFWEGFRDKYEKDIAYIDVDTAYIKNGEALSTAMIADVHISGFTAITEAYTRAIFSEYDRQIIWLNEKDIKLRRYTRWK